MCNYAQSSSDLSYLKKAFISVKKAPLPLSQEDRLKILALKNQLLDFRPQDTTDTDIRLEVSYLLKEVQYILLQDILPIKDNYNIFSQEFLQYSQEFCIIKTKSEKWLSEQHIALYMIEKMIHQFYLNYQTQGQTEQFFAIPIFKEWYDANIFNHQLQQAIDSVLYIYNDPYHQLQILDPYDKTFNSICSSIFLHYDCNYLADLMAPIKMQINALDSIKQHRQIQETNRLLMIAKAENTQRIADSLYDIQQLDKALSFYEEIQNINFFDNHASDCAAEIKSRQKQQYVFDHFIYDSEGRLNIDSTKQLSPIELERFKSNRFKISNVMIESLHQFEIKLYKDSALQLTDFKTLSLFQITDTTYHLYKITCDSSGIQTIDHELIAGNQRDGGTIHQLIENALLNTFPLLKINDDQSHEYWIPVAHFPGRPIYPNRVNYFCNCHSYTLRGVGYPNQLECIETDINYSPASSYPDYNYLIITDCRPISH